MFLPSANHSSRLKYTLPFVYWVMNRSPCSSWSRSEVMSSRKSLSLASAIGECRINRCCLFPKRCVCMSIFSGRGLILCETSAWTPPIFLPLPAQLILCHECLFKNSFCLFAKIQDVSMLTSIFWLLSFLQLSFIQEFVSDHSFRQPL